MERASLERRLQDLGAKMTTDPNLSDRVLLATERVPLLGRVRQRYRRTLFALACSTALTVALAFGGVYGRALIALAASREGNDIALGALAFGYGFLFFAIVFVLLLIPAIWIYVLVPRLLAELTRRRAYGRLWMALASCCLAALVAYIVETVRSQPTPQPVHESLDIHDRANCINVTEIRVDPADDRRTRITLHAANKTSGHEYLGLSCYANGGRILFYAPGASARAFVRYVQPNWSGEITFDVQTPQFVSGGNLRVTIYRYYGAGVEPPDPFFISPEDGEQLWDHTYVLVPSGSW